MRDFRFNFVGMMHREFGGGQGSLTAPFVFPPGNWNFSPPQARRWKFVGWGAGTIGDVTFPGGSGGYVEKTALLTTATVVVIKVGGPGFVQDTTIDIPGQFLVTAGHGVPNFGGTCSNGDVNLNGSAGANPGAGSGGGANVSSAAGAPGVLPFRGGAGFDSPGGGSLTSGASTNFGHGLVLAFAV